MDLNVWQYRLTCENGRWLADVVLRSDGFFAAASDWGNYAFRWTHPGMEFRKFIVGLEKSPDYVCGKLARRDWYDGEATLRRIRERILQGRREQAISDLRARTEWDLLKEVLSTFGSSEDVRSIKEMDLPTFVRWHDQTGLHDASEICAYNYRPDARSFCREVMPRLAEAIRAELAPPAAATQAP